MRNVIVFRLADGDAVWLADLEAGTVCRADEGADEARNGVMQGVKVAVAAEARTAAASHQFFPSR